MKRLDPDALYVALDRQRRRRRMQWRAVAAEAGVSASTLTRIGQGKRPDADGLVRLLDWLGTTDLAPYLIGAVAGVRRVFPCPNSRCRLHYAHSGPCDTTN